MAKAKPTAQPERFISSSLFGQYGIHGIFSLRTGGISPAPFDSQNFGATLGDSDDNITSNLNTFIHASQLPNIPHQAIQTHHSNSLWCSGAGYMHAHEADILLTDQLDTALAVRTADCLPVLLVDPQAGISAAVHAGWRGTAMGVVQKGVQQMLAHGARAQHILVSLGPCIGPCCFRIAEDTAIALKKSTKKASQFIGQHADLQQINRLQLLDCGILQHQIECIKACTSCDNKRFFSFRRDAGTTGRHLAVVAIASTP